MALWINCRSSMSLHLRRCGSVVDSISHPEDDVAVSAAVFPSLVLLRGTILPAPPRHLLAAPALEEPAEGTGLAQRLEAFLKVLIVVAVDNGINARISKGQPVGKGEDVAGNKIQLVSVQVTKVHHHHQGPERQPGKHEQKSHHDEHLYHRDLFPGYHRLPGRPFPGVDRALGHRRLSPGELRGGQLDSDACVHDRDDGQRQQVDMQEQNHRVDFPHVCCGKVFVAGVDRQRVVEVVAVHHVVIRELLHGQCQSGRTHDHRSQHPNQQDGHLGHKYGWFGE